jgi:hypothetical protein
LSHYGLAIYIKKHLKAKEEELWKLKYFTMQKYNLIFKKYPLKETKILLGRQGQRNSNTQIHQRSIRRHEGKNPKKKNVAFSKPIRRSSLEKFPRVFPR